MSSRTFFIKFNRDIEDKSIRIPITCVKEFGADFDGDQMYVWFIPDLFGKVAGYANFGHQQMLDPNKPFRTSRFATRASTFRGVCPNVFSKDFITKCILNFEGNTWVAQNPTHPLAIERVAASQAAAAPVAPATAAQPAQPAQPAWAIFHPACESIMSKETEIFKVIRKLTAALERTLQSSWGIRYQSQDRYSL
ncbi:hypothetical protein AP1_0454 [Aeromonas phage AP1]|nr:hypothetical protein AP1_0454 [Aeromonas phage AP1]